jgi:hypothetical protein
VRVNKGTIEATDELDDVGPEDWHLLLGARKYFVRVHVPSDCRKLLKFVGDAERMYEALGFNSVDDLIRRGLEIDPTLVDWAVKGLKSLQPDEPVTLDTAVDAGKRVRQRAERAEPLAEPGAVGRGRPNPIEQDRVDNINSNESESKGGTSADYLTRRIARDAPDVLEQMKQGKFKSVRKAAIAAGIIREKTRVEQATALVRKMTDQELYDFEDQFNAVLQKRKRE